MGKSHFQNRDVIKFRLSSVPKEASGEAVVSAKFAVSAEDRTDCALNQCQRRHQQCAYGQAPTLRIKDDDEYECFCKSPLPVNKNDGIYVDKTVIVVIVVVLVILLIKFLLFPLAVTACMPILGYQSGFGAKLKYFYCHPCESSAACCCILCCGEIPESLQSGGEP